MTYGCRSSCLHWATHLPPPSLPLPLIVSYVLSALQPAVSYFPPFLVSESLCVFLCRTVRCDPFSSSLPTSPLPPPNQSPFVTLVLLLPCFLSVEKADCTPLSTSDQAVVTTTATEILKSTLHTIAQPSGLKYPSSQFLASYSLRVRRTMIKWLDSSDPRHRREISHPSRPGHAKVSGSRDPDWLLNGHLGGGPKSVGVPQGIGNSVGVWNVSPCTVLPRARPSGVNGRRAAAAPPRAPPARRCPAGVRRRLWRPRLHAPLSAAAPDAAVRGGGEPRPPSPPPPPPPPARRPRGPGAEGARRRRGRQLRGALARFRGRKSVVPLEGRRSPRLVVGMRRPGGCQRLPGRRTDKLLRGSVHGLVDPPNMGRVQA